LACEAIGIALGTRDVVEAAKLTWVIIFSIYALSMLLPGLSVSVRRLHDIDFTGWWLLLAFVPIASLALIVFYVMEGNPGINRFGPNSRVEVEATL
jgi:uncharacterized membrane protein YhaH (DUF805 family)